MDVQPTRDPPPRRLSDFLRSSRDEILSAWEASVRKLRAARNLDRPLLLDHMPHFIEDLAHYADDLRAGLDVRPPEEHPRIHALERLEVGYDLAEVVEEYSLLRRCILDLVVENGAPAMRSVEMPLLHQAIDRAIATSVVRYTEARERTLRALDRISSAALLNPESTSPLPAALEAFLGNTASVDSVAVALRENQRLVVRGAAGFPVPPPEVVPPNGFFHRVLEAGAPIFVRDASAEPSLEDAAFRLAGTHAMYGVPIVIGEQSLGVAVMGSRTSYEFSQEDQFLFRTLVHRVAGLIAQARLAAELARRAAELEAVIASLPEAVYVGDTREIRLANQAALRLLGFDRVEDMTGLPGKLEPRRLDGTPLAPGEQPFHRAVGGERSESEVVFRNQKTGEDVIVQLSAGPVLVRGTAHGAVVVARDITERKKAEEELRAAFDFRERVLGILGHDLRNPLTVILTSASLLQRMGGLDERQQLAIARMTNNAQRIERMVHDLLDYTRVRQGKGMRLERRECDLLPLCQQVVDGLQVVHPERTFRVDAQGDTRGQWDPDRALQVVSNLLSNAVRYGAEGTPITLRLRNAGDAVLLDVHNFGPPIQPDLLPKLFEAFERAGADDTGRSAGLGLGLWIVHQIVTAHGGALSVTSSAEEGTRFTVRWPRTSEAHAGAGATA